MNLYKVEYTEEDDIGILNTVWEKANVAEITMYPWKKPKHDYSPSCSVKLLHGREGINVRFETIEDNIRATYTQPNDPVCRDSCVEFFFTPNQVDKKYLSFEINPLGALLIGVETNPEDLKFLYDDRKQFKIETILEEKSWMVKFFIPYNFIKLHFDLISNNFKGNFMKCADMSKTPHHGSWNLIQTEFPKFHAPEYFGLIKLKN